MLENILTWLLRCRHVCRPFKIPLDMLGMKTYIPETFQNSFI